MTKPRRLAGVCFEGAIHPAAAGSARWGCAHDNEPDEARFYCKPAQCNPVRGWCVLSGGLSPRQDDPWVVVVACFFRMFELCRSSGGRGPVLAR